jgi:adenine-specific DNA-methyltransferase
MELKYNNKLSFDEVVKKSSNYKVEGKKGKFDNKLIFGDNLNGLNYLINKENLKGKVDLIYIDPPFATNNTFSIDEGSRVSTISNSKNGSIAYSDKLKGYDFIEFLRERVILLRELLSDNGSFYLHIDYKIGHYVKVMLDEVFGINNFRNDITRIKCNPKNFKRKGYGNIKDLILFYSKSDEMIWNEPKVPYSDTDIEKLYSKSDKDGRRYTTVPIHAPGETLNSSNQIFKGMNPPKGRHWRTNVEELERLDKVGLIEWSSKGNPRMIIFADEKEGKRVQDIWEYKDPQYPLYPTQKNSDLLDFIIKTSSNTNSLVLDCFCGSGSTLLSALRNERNWIGIDASEESMKVVKKQLKEQGGTLFGDYSDYDYIHLKGTE